MDLDLKYISCLGSGNRQVNTTPCYCYQYRTVFYFLYRSYQVSAIGVWCALRCTRHLRLHLVGWRERERRRPAFFFCTFLIRETASLTPCSPTTIAIPPYIHALESFSMTPCISRPRIDRPFLVFIDLSPSQMKHHVTFHSLLEFSFHHP